MGCCDAVFTAPVQVRVRSKALCRLYGVGVAVIVLYTFVYSVAINNDFAQFRTPVFLANAWLDGASIGARVTNSTGLGSAWYCSNDALSFGYNLDLVQQDIVGGFVFPPGAPCRSFSSATDFGVTDSTVSFVTSEVLYNEAGNVTGASIVQGVGEIAFHLVLAQAVPMDRYVQPRTLLRGLSLYSSTGEFIRELPLRYAYSATVNEVLALANVSLDELNTVEGFTLAQSTPYRISGMQILCSLQCNNDGWFRFLLATDCSISFSALRGFFSVLPPQGLSARFGVRITFVPGGRIGEFSVGGLITVLVNLIVLLGSATVAVDIIARFFFPRARRQIYNRLRFVSGSMKRDSSDANSLDKTPSASQLEPLVTY